MAPPHAFRNFLVKSRLTIDRLTRSALFHGADNGLHGAHLAYPYQLASFVSPKLTDGVQLLLGVWKNTVPLRVRQTPNRRELGNIGVIARTRGGKGLLAKAQILSWTGSIIINDIKGDLYDDTAAYRATMSTVFVIDTRGVGHRYDPIAGKTTSGELRGIAKYLLLEADEKGKVFTDRAVKMLTALFVAARLEGLSPIAYCAHLIHTGMKAAVKRLQAVSEHHGLAPQDNLATRFLGEAIDEVNFDSQFLIDAFATLSSKIEDIIEDSTLACVSGSDVAAKDIIAGDRPLTVYLRWPERHIQAYAPLIQLVVSTLIDEMCAVYDDRKGKGCREVLFVLDEAGRTPIAGLPEFVTTVAGRNITLALFYQSLAQPEAIYGAARAKIIIDNLDSILWLRPPVGNRETAKAIEEICGEISRFAHSETAYHGREASEGKSEKAVPVLSAWEVKRMKDDEVVVMYRDVPPFLTHRVDVRNFPHLVARMQLIPPTLAPLPQAPQIPPLADETQEPDDKFGPSG